MATRKRSTKQKAATKTEDKKTEAKAAISVKSIAEEFGVDQKKLRAKMRKNGFSAEGGRYSLNEEQAAEVREMAESLAE